MRWVSLSTPFRVQTLSPGCQACGSFVHESRNGVERLGAGVDRLNAHESSPAPTVFELNHACGTGKQRVVFASTHILARLEPGASLADDNGSSRDHLPAESFDSQSL